jgi:hypothetical protein
MVELFTARSGAPSLRVNGVALHSPYDPRREASRFVQETIGSERPSAVIVLGESIGHVVEAVARLRPGALLLAAVYSAEIAAASTLRGLPSWHPGCPVAFDEFLRDHLAELQIEGLRVIEWPPSARAFPAVSRLANDAVRQVIQEMNGSFVTTVAAGRLWLRNCLANFIHVSGVVSGPLCPPGSAVLVAAPGPSLERAMPVLEELRRGLKIWALPSSCPALLDSGIEPDLVVLTDPGFYAMHHLQFAAPRCPLAMPLSAARGSWELPSRPPVVLLEQPFLAEKALLEAAGITAPVVPPHGTVAATAIELALASTRGPVIVAGLDLASVDLRSHARPNAFDRLLRLQASRLEPHESLSFHRAAAQGSVADGKSVGLRTTPALRTYAGWMGAGFNRETGRLHRFLPSAIDVPAMSPLDPAGLRALLSGLPQAPDTVPLEPAPGYPAESRRRQIAAEVLASWSAETEGARAALASARSGWEPGRFPRAVDLAYLVAPRRLVDALRKRRMGDTDAARAAAAETLDECGRFLGELAGRLNG